MSVFGRECVGERVVEQPPAGRQRDHAPALAQLDGVGLVAGAQRRLDDVDAQHHPRPAAERDVVDPAALERRRRAVVDGLERVAERERVGDVALGAEPVEPVREQREDVNPHRGTPGRRRSRRAATSIERTASPTIGTSSSSPPSRTTSSTSTEGSSRISRTVPTARSPSVTAQPSSSCAQYSPGSSAGASASATRSTRPVQPLDRLARVAAAQAHDRLLVGAGAAHDLAEVGRRPERQQPRARGDDVEGAVAAVGAPDAPRLEEALHRCYSTMSRRTRRLSLTAAALMTVRSACAVRPPRPITRP